MCISELLETYQRQQNTLYPKGGKFYEINFLGLLIGSQLIKEEKYVICGKPGLHSINLDNARNFFHKI